MKRKPAVLKFPSKFRSDPVIQKEFLFMNRFLYFLLFIFILTMNSFLVSGQSCISGKIINTKTGLPIPSANIKISDNSGTVSDEQGEFRICNLHSTDVNITVSFIGFETTHHKMLLKPGENKSVVISLIPTAVLMDELVVTATRTENEILDVPARINTVSLKTIQSIPNQSIDEVIKFIPGINYSRPFGIFSTKATLTMRGMSGKEQARVLVLLDGTPLNKSDGGTVDWNMVDMNSVQKVEITKGAGSALYGGNAMGGIINIITGQPAGKFSVGASFEEGSFNTFGGKLKLGGRIDKSGSKNSFYWLASTFYKQSDGYITQSEIDVRANPYIVKSNMKEAGGIVKTGYSFGNKQSVEATVKYYNDHRGTGEKEFQPDGNVTDHDTYGSTLTYKGSVKKISLNSSLYFLTENYKKVNEYLKDDYTWYNVLSVRSDYGWTTTLTGPAGKNQVFTGGIDLKNGGVDAYDKYFTSTDIVYNKGKMNTSALFAQDEINLPGDKIRVVAGLRFDMVTYYDGSFRIESPTMETEFMRGYQAPNMPTQHWKALSPRLSVQYKWNSSTRIYALYSRGFRASTLDDLCRSGRIKGGFKIANPLIKPEYLSNYETGFDISPSATLHLSGSLYYSRGRDFQYYVSNGQTIDMGFGDRPIFIRDNISDVEIYGAEAELKYDITPSLSIFGNYAYTHSTILKYSRISANDTIDLTGKFLTDIPDHILCAGATYLNRFVNSSLYLRYTSPMWVNDQNSIDEVILTDRYAAFTTADIKFWKEIKKHYKLTLNIQNLLDVKYYDSKDAVCPGRFITGEFSVNF
jgi:outer membrane receptor protein involved in Fe transport